MKTILRLICIILCLSTLALTACTTTTSTNNDIVEAGKNDSPQNNNGIAEVGTQKPYSDPTIKFLLPETPLTLYDNDFDASLTIYELSYDIYQYDTNKYRLRLDCSVKAGKIKKADFLPIFSFGAKIVDPEGNMLDSEALSIMNVTEGKEEKLKGYFDLELDPSKTYSIIISHS